MTRAAETMVEMAAPPPVVNPPVRNLMHHCLGGALLLANKVRHAVQGYRTPRPFAATEMARAIAYDLSVVSGWLRHLRLHAGDRWSLAGCSVLELGPGPDLGTGVVLLSQGAQRYTAFDAYALAERVPEAFYEDLLREIVRRGGGDVDGLRSEVALARGGGGARLRYVWRADFDLSVLEPRSVDVVFSQSAFEHFDDVAQVIAQLSAVVKTGAQLVIQVDLSTHSRWVRDVDPLNIYRYADWLYRLAKFSGTPNRLRPHEYRALLQRHGWCDVSMAPLAVAADAYVDGVRATLNRHFRDPINQMHVLSVMICATKA